MLSVIVNADESARHLVPTLAALIPGALAGVVSDVLVTTSGIDQDVEDVADHAGCALIASGQPLGARLAEAAATSRGTWLLFLRSGRIPDSLWVEEARRFMAQGPASARGMAGHFTPAATGRDGVIDALQGVVRAVWRPAPSPDEGLLIAKPHYRLCGGHRDDRHDPEAALLQRVGRRNIQRLQSSIQQLI